MKTQFGHYTRHFSRHAEFISASLKGPETSSGRRTCFGRSMIEMLGVLAIIGVLSIGGIVLYRRAVNNHQANTILDDVNRFAFVIMESNRAFSTNAFIDNIEYSKTSTYNLDAFLGAGSGQFGIVATDIPKGVCEPFVDKAVVEYKVRVLPANTAESVVQISATGTVYDSFHKDICINDINDVVLYFGDTSTQCNVPDESGYTPCTENSDCCAGFFCAFENATGYSDDKKGGGSCRSFNDYPPQSTVKTSNGQIWTHSGKTMTWWSAQNWCATQGLKPATLEDIGCKGVWAGNNCTKSTTLKEIGDGWSTANTRHWLEYNGSDRYARFVLIDTKYIGYYADRNVGYCALCH